MAARWAVVGLCAALLPVQAWAAAQVQLPASGAHGAVLLQSVRVRPTREGTIQSATTGITRGIRECNRAIQGA